MRSGWLIGLVSFLLAASSATCGGGGGGGGNTSEVQGAGVGPGDAIDYASLSGDIKIDGSSTVGPIAEAYAEEFGALNDVRVAVGISGTGGGFEKFCRGETDINDASRPMKLEESYACGDREIESVEVRVALDGITMAVSADNDFVQCLTYTQLRQLWSPDSKIKKWSDLDPAFPNEDIKFFSPGADSGTFDYFTEEVVGALDLIRSDDVTFSEDDNVLVLGVGADKYAIGYFGYAYFKNATGLRAIEVDKDIDRRGTRIPDGERVGCQAPNEQTISDFTYGIARPLYMYVNTKSLKEKPQVRGFMEYILENHEQLVADVGYIALNAAQFAEVQSYWDYWIDKIE
jgi:phosphate transport system substrate-binding protein